MYVKDEIKNSVKNSGLKHIAVIMDGNRRWAKEKFLPVASGHKKGVDALRAAIEACINFGIDFLTVYAFSTENWNRDKDEVDFLMSLFAKTVVAELPEFRRNNVKVRFIGNRSGLNGDLVNLIETCEKETENHTTLNLQIAFNYGSRAEITDTVKILCNKVKSGVLAPDDINEDIVNSNLYTKDLPDPDMLIRTGGEKRISNFLLWQCAYSEIYVTDKYWPDFDAEILAEAIEEFSKRNRRFGK